MRQTHEPETPLIPPGHSDGPNYRAKRTVPRITGLVTFVLRPHVQSVTALDSSEGTRDVLTSKIRDSGMTSVTTRLMNLKGPDGEGTYELMISSMTLHHIRDVPRLLHHWYSVLLPGGTLAIADIDKEE
ncbi:class I SAM-dependent methyltransferase [Methanoregula sp.]|uniref:class I SAM-dependent methyltransferase n=1 Tax=Methanoregula sp. TaxID=2052170 RepID=UPI0025E8DE89|nr:methyltransferase domain-containing protein [Methanoregula sp.]